MKNKILASVNGKNITSADIEQYLNTLDPQTAARYRNEEGMKSILNELISQKLFLADAIDNNLDEIEAFKLEMDKARDFILTQLNINLIMTGIDVSEEEIKKHFEENPAKYNTPEKANTSHILVESLEQCSGLREQIVNNEITFEDAARDFSSCPSKENGGNLGEYAKGQMVPEYDEVAFNLPIGEISEPVKTQFGYHLIKVLEKKESQKAEFAKVKQQIHNDLLQEKQRNAYRAKINEMKQQYQIELF
ncbi:MAG: peptidylprolyl isomerase [Candidatus Cloacimonetes bacterium]|nr:peptidylprolyl isomerase [Candidatus Cloacimonadota bacterium]